MKKSLVAFRRTYIEYHMLLAVFRRSYVEYHTHCFIDCFPENYEKNSITGLLINPMNVT